MKYKFPEINHIDEVREAIAGRDEFIVAERDGFLVLNYLVNFEDTFPIPDTKDPALNRLYTLRRECRGLKFYPDGAVAARPYHKFFNVNERPETLDYNLDFNQGFTILDKLDGSMIHPMRLDGNIVWCTKMGLTDTAQFAQQYVDSVIQSMAYHEFADEMMTAGKTPIFEWCSRDSRIVVDYPEDQLILTAIRDNRTGLYHTRTEMVRAADRYGVPVVGAWSDGFNDIADFIKVISAREDEEGYVIRWDSGHMSKAKNSWYVNLHKTKELLSFEKDVIALILRDDQDDAKAFMDDEDKAKIDSFAEDLHNGMTATADRLNWVVIEAKDNLNESKKRFAMEVALVADPLDKGLLFAIWDGKDPLSCVKDAVMKNTGTKTKVESVRPLIGGIKWERY